MNKPELGQIIGLQIKDLGLIEFMAWKLDGKEKLLKVVGPNDSGKSTILDSVKYALEGSAAIPNDVIRHGSHDKKAVINIETSTGYRITRKIRESKDNKQVEELEVTLNGAPVNAAQTFLSSLQAKYPDPQRLADMTGAQLYAKLADLIEPKVKDINASIEAEKLKAQVARKQLKDLGAKPEPIGGLSDEFIPIEDATANLLAANETLTAAKDLYREKSDKLAGIKTEHANGERRLEEIADAIAKLEAERETVVAMVEEKAKTIALGETAVAKRKAEMDAAQEAANAAQKVYDQAQGNRLIGERIKAIKEWEEKAASYEQELSDSAFAVEELEASRKQIVESTDLGARGLKIESGMVTIEGTPWDNASTSTRLVAASEMSAASIPEGGLRVLYVQRGESIGSEKRVALAEFAEKNNVMIFMEIMSEQEVSKEPGVVHIVSGEIKFGAESAKPAPKAAKTAAIDKATTTVAPPPKPAAVTQEDLF